MAFFKKLRERLFKSSSKIDEGLEAIVEEGGELADGDADFAEPPELSLDAPEKAPTQDAARHQNEARQKDEADQLAQQAVARTEAAQAQKLEQERAEQAAAKAEHEARLQREAEERARQETERQQHIASEREAAKLEAARLETERLAAEQALQEARLAAQAAEEQRRTAAAAEAETARKLAQDAADAKEAAERIAADVAKRAAEQEEADRRKAQAAQAERLAAQQAEEARRAAEAAEAARIADAQTQAARAAAAQSEAEKQAKSLADQAVPATDPDPAPTRGFLGRLFGRREQKAVVRRVLDDDMLEQLEELLITADMGVDTALRVTANMAEGRFGKKLSVQEIKHLMASEIARIMEPVAKPLPLYPKTPQVVLVVGVNGSGKTTTIGKLASQFRAAGKKVVIAAGDTFRAAAVEQLQVWGERAGVPVLTAPEGSDPASLAYDAMSKAQADGADLLMIDTAGRLQNRSDLMEELAKIVRVIRKKDETAPHNTLLVLDATTGQNALNQVKVFQEVSDVSGLVMTKLDGTAKGGVLVALADKFGLPIHAIGVGEQIDDLAPFDPEEFAAALTGLDPD